PTAGRDVAAQQPVGGGADAVLGLAPLGGTDGHGSFPAAASMAWTTVRARSCSAARRRFSPAGTRGLPRNVSVVFALPSQIGRWCWWNVACGHRAASESPARGDAAVGVPASFRQRALAGSVNQQ